MPSFAETLALELHDIQAVARLREMEIEIDERGGRVFDRRETLVELARGEQSLQQGVRHGFLRHVMAGEAAQDRRFFEPMFIELRGKLDEVTGDVRARYSRIGDVRQESMQGMAEFMEQGMRVVIAQQTGFAGGGLGKIHHIDDDGQNFAVELFLLAKGRHPSAAVLRRAGKIIADEERAASAVRIRHVPDTAIAMIKRNVLAFGE